MTTSEPTTCEACRGAKDAEIAELRDTLGELLITLRWADLMWQPVGTKLAAGKIPDEVTMKEGKRHLTEFLGSLTELADRVEAALARRLAEEGKP